MARPLAASCANMNHGRANVPVAYCVQCGRVVNDGLIGGARCDDERHAQARRRRLSYCADCGRQLVVSR